MKKIMKKLMKVLTISVIVLVGLVILCCIATPAQAKNNTQPKQNVSMEIIENNSHNGKELDSLTYNVKENNKVVATEKIDFINGTYTFQNGKINYTKSIDNNKDAISYADLIYNVYNNLK